jgi:cycloartenol synthase
MVEGNKGRGILQVYTQLEDGGSNVVQTAWALLALIAARYHLIDRKPIEAGIKVLLKLQEPSGDWPQQQITGVFNRNCMITYANYRYSSRDYSI